MALDPKIASIKASGVYRFEFDKSQVVGIPANQVRLVTGFSKKGPFNTPVFVPDSAFFKQVFGDIDRNLEKKESYFHRSCLAALERGPILALNLLSLDSEDKVHYLQMSTAATPANIQDNIGEDGEYSRFYNQDKFWYPDSHAFLNLLGANGNQLHSNSTNDLLNFVNLGKSPVSIIVKKAAAANVSGFNVTVENWYGTANVPGFLNKSSLVSDFMVDVYVIEGNYGGEFGASQPYGRFAADPVFQDYFDPTKGLKRRKFQSDSTDTMIQEFFNLSEVRVIAQYTASLLPDFVDLVGNNLFIQKVINADTATTGVFCSVNEDLFSGDFLIDGVAGGIDLIGHNIKFTETSSSEQSVNFLSYQDSITADLVYQREVATTHNVTIASGETINVTSSSATTILIQVQGTAGDSLFDAFSSMTANTANTLGTYIYDSSNIVYVPVTNVIKSATTVSVTLSAIGTSHVHFPTTLGTTYTYINAADLNMVVHKWDGFADSAVSDIIGSYGTSLYSKFADGTLTDGDKAIYKDGGIQYKSYLVSNEINYGYIHIASPTIGTNAIDISDPAYFIPAVLITPYETDKFVTKTHLDHFSIDGSGRFINTSGAQVAANTLNIQTLKGSLNVVFDAISDYTTETKLKANQILILSDAIDVSSIIVGNYFVNDDGFTSGTSRLTRINQVVGGLTTAQYSTIPAGKTGILVTCQNEILVTNVNESNTTYKKVELYYPIDKWVDYLNIFTFKGFNLDPMKHIPNGTNDRQNAILNGTLVGTNLYRALTDRDVINFRYVIDTFGNGIESGSKSIYTNLCADRKNAFAILNAPSAKNFKNSTDPSFKDLTGALSTMFISQGGNLSLNPTVRYSLPSPTDGASWGAFYFPYITVRDLGKNINVPPAAYVSNNFITKYSNALPWSLVAGVRRGVVGGTGVVGLEINLDKTDREYLEPFGINPIVFQSGTGPTIFANKTAQQTTKSALSSINVREVVIYIQDGIEAILKNYLFEFNTAQTRLEIKTLADNFLSIVHNDDGVYDYKNIMDESNNTPDVIDQNIGILDTYIEPVRGMEILVQRTTILKTGAISTGNFQ
jgi:hypothetical protein